MDTTPFDPLVDPEGILATVDQNQYFHTLEMKWVICKEK
jgi:hypothetical protein